MSERINQCQQSVVLSDSGVGTVKAISEPLLAKARSLGLPFKESASLDGAKVYVKITISCPRREVCNNGEQGVDGECLAERAEKSGLVSKGTIVCGCK